MEEVGAYPILCHHGRGDRRVTAGQPSWVQPKTAPASADLGPWDSAAALQVSWEGRARPSRASSPSTQGRACPLLKEKQKTTHKFSNYKAGRVTAACKPGPGPVGEPHTAARSPAFPFSHPIKSNLLPLRKSPTDAPYPTPGVQERSLALSVFPALRGASQIDAGSI